MRGQQMSVKAAIVACVALLLVLATGQGCGGSGGTPDGGPNVDAAPNVCGNGSYGMCGGTCVDLQGDSQNCGTCGTVCPTNEVCTHGVCASVCGGGTFTCNGNCADFKTDPKNCGGCGKACPTGMVCTQTTCALTCQAGETDCAGSCVDTTSDDFNCSACGNACPTGQQCVNSTCQATCQSGWTSCPNGDSGTTCVDTTSDPQNCNGCGNKCPNGYFCQAGKCSLMCAGGTSLCGTACVDENIDPNNCGACSKSCGSGNVCSNANCCPTATPYYCGGCNTFANCVLKSGGHIAAGPEHTCAINPSGALKCWGYGGDGELGNSATSTYNTPQAVTTLTSGVATVSAWYEGNCAVTTAGTPYCWGYNGYGAVGNGNTTSPVSSPALICNGSSCSSKLSGAALIGGGGIYGANCVLLSSGAIDCAGNNEWGSMLNGTTGFTTYDYATTTQITSGAIYVGGGGSNYYGALCAVMSSGSVKCWGYAPDGLGDGVNTMSGSAVTVSGISGAVQVSVGEENICVIEQGGVLKCWGYGYYGANGDGTSTTWSTPVTASLGSVVAVSVGSEFTCAVTSAGAVYCIGYNSYGQLGNGTTSFSPTTTWQQAISSGAVGVACGDEHTCALMANGQAYCWGANFDGQVGDGTYTQRTSPVLVTGF